MSSTESSPPPDDVFVRYFAEHDRPPTPPLDTAASLEAVTTRMAQRTRGKGSGRHPRPRARAEWRTPSRPLGVFVGIGAAALLLSVVGGVVFHFGRATGSVQHYQTQPGQRSTVRLADGSTVILAPATSVTVSPTTADVVGEAYFTVAPHASHPRIVHTTNATVQVLGTAFVVRQYANEQQTRVVVGEGKVALRARHNGIQSDRQTVVTAQMLAQVTDSGVAVQRGIAVSDYTAWTQGRLIFDAIPLRDVIQELSRAYGVEIRLTDSAMAHQTMTLSASVRDDPLAYVLNRIAPTIDAHVARDGSAFVILPGRSADHGSMHESAPTPQIKRFPQPEKQYGR